jgi:SNF2 family DNA or RNA helicase
MQLRLACLHPLLVRGLSEQVFVDGTFDQDSQLKQAESMEAWRERLLLSGSGKMQLLAKLLPDLQKKGRKAIIFSQFKMVSSSSCSSLF